MTKEKAKDIALITAIIIQEEIIDGSLFHVFDKAYEVAVKFNAKFPEDFIWEELDFEETVSEYAQKILMES